MGKLIRSIKYYFFWKIYYLKKKIIFCNPVFGISKSKCSVCGDRAYLKEDGKCYCVICQHRRY